jgi:hypothetical protein
VRFALALAHVPAHIAKVIALMPEFVESVILRISVSFMHFQIL